MGAVSPDDAPDVAALQRILADGSAGLHRALLRDLPATSFFVFDRDLRFVFAEGAGIRRHGLDPELDVERRTLDEALPSEFAALRAPLQDVLTGAGGDIELTLGDGGIWLHTAPIVGNDGAIVGGLAIAVDVSERRRADAELHARLAQQAAVATLGRRALEGASVSTLLDAAAALVAERLSVDRVSIIGYDEEAGVMSLRAGVGWPREVIRRTVVPLNDAPRSKYTERLSAGPRIIDDLAADDDSVHPPMREVLLEQGVRSMMTVLIGRGSRPFGTLTALTLTPRSFSAEDADFLQAVANVLWDAIERHDVDAANEHAALHDPLTELPNRRLLLDRLERALAGARDSRAAVAVLLLDLDHFKVINDSLGHGGGDELLRALAPRLRAAARDCDTIVRLGGDEFVLACEGVLSEEHAMELALRLLQTLDSPFIIGGRRHVIRGSIGVVVDDGSSTPEGVLRDADTAMYRAKENGRGRCELFSPVMRVRAVARQRTETELRGAAERGELRIHYQPLFAISDRRLVGMEALVRWERPDHGLVPPSEFIPVAEETGMIVALGEWVLDTAASQLAKWTAELDGAERLGIAINVSGRQLSMPDFDETVASAIARSGLPADRFALEVTESMLMEQTDVPLTVLASLRRLGVQIVLDDFGTGYSSLSRLQDFPLDVLKIDRTFIDRLGDDPDREPIVVAIVAMARALGLQVIAEGVETESALERLASLQCGIAQGFLLSRPVSPAQMADLMRRELMRLGPHDNVVALRRAPGA